MSDCEMLVVTIRSRGRVQVNGAMLNFVPAVVLFEMMVLA